MLIIVTWDDSDGWYDHVMPQIVSQSNDPLHDALLGRAGLCGHAQHGTYQDQCGYGPRPNPNTTGEFYVINNRRIFYSSDLGTHRAESSNRNNL